MDVATGEAIDVEELLIARGNTRQCPHYGTRELTLEWQDSATLLVPVCNYQAEGLSVERIAVRLDP